MSDEKIKVFTGSGSFNIQDEMLKDSKHLGQLSEQDVTKQEPIKQVSLKFNFCFCQF